MASGTTPSIPTHRNRHSYSVTDPKLRSGTHPNIVAIGQDASALGRNWATGRAFHSRGFPLRSHSARDRSRRTPGRQGVQVGRNPCSMRRVPESRCPPPGLQTPWGSRIRAPGWRTVPTWGMPRSDRSTPPGLRNPSCGARACTPDACGTEDCDSASRGTARAIRARLRIPDWGSGVETHTQGSAFRRNPGL